MIKAIIVDDEEKNREGLAKMVEQFCDGVEIVGIADCVDSAKKLIDKYDPGLIFLDIEMPGGDGFTLLEDTKDPNFDVIFTTAHAAYAIKAIKFAALDYLLKPINLTELRDATNKAVHSIKNRENTNERNQKYDTLRENRDIRNFNFKKIALPTLEGLEFYEISNILRCEADRAYCKFYLTTGERIVVSKSLKEYEELLTECNFFRVHKSNMVNLDHITKYIRGKGGYVILSDGSNVDVSVRKKEELMQILASS